jgi:hypothetical protein
MAKSFKKESKSAKMASKMGSKKTSLKIKTQTKTSSKKTIKTKTTRVILNTFKGNNAKNNDEEEEYGERRVFLLRDSLAIVLAEENRRRILSEFARVMPIVHANQRRTARAVVKAFDDRRVANVMVVAKTQSGKTGTFAAVIRQYMESAKTYIPIENIYILSGLSSCEWKTQTKSRMPECLRRRVYHRNDLLSKSFVEEMKTKHNVLLIIDEIQVASQHFQTIHQAFTNIGLTSLDFLYERDIKLLEITATPDGTIYDLMKWGAAASFILAEPGDNYVGAVDLWKMGRVRQSEDLSFPYYNPDDPDQIPVSSPFDELKRTIEDSFDAPKYHIIRATGDNTEQVMRNFHFKFPSWRFAYMIFDQSSPIVNINDILSLAPEKHTFIFVKEMLRCSVTLIKQHLGILYERWSNHVLDSVIIQGLLGRCTGYDDPGQTIVYTNIDSIKKYEKLWECQFQNNRVKWVSNTTKYVGRTTRPDATFLLIGGLQVIKKTKKTKKTTKKTKKTTTTTTTILENRNNEEVDDICIADILADYQNASVSLTLPTITEIASIQQPHMMTRAYLRLQSRLQAILEKQKDVFIPIGITKKHSRRIIDDDEDEEVRPSSVVKRNILVEEDEDQDIRNSSPISIDGSFEGSINEFVHDTSAFSPIDVNLPIVIGKSIRFKKTKI